MPASGDQHSAVANPFEEPRPRVSEFTAQEIATLQARLEKQLGPEYISSRAGPSGQKVHYVAAEKCIALANEVFGFNGWSSSIQNVQVDFVDEAPGTLKVSLGLSVVVRVTLRDGTYHEDIGYGHIENCKGKAAAFEKAKKEGTTDALKRALRNFGNLLGNCIYDKTYLAKVTKLKVTPAKFDEGNLYRHGDYVKKEEKEAADVKMETEASEANATGIYEDFLGDMDEIDFCVTEDGHPDEVVLPTSMQPNSNERLQNRPTNSNNAPMQPPSRPLARSSSNGNQQRAPQTPNAQPPRPGGQQVPPNQGGRQQQPTGSGPRANQGYSGAIPGQSAASAGLPQPGAPHNGDAAGSEATGFFSARAVSQLPEESLKSGPVVPSGGQVFNPRAESPSIRKTPGIDHTTSKPLARNGQHVAPSAFVAAADGAAFANGNAGSPMPAASGGARPATAVASVSPALKGNVVNPQLDQARRIGAPGNAGSPLANRGQYRPPTMKRPLPSEGVAAAGGAGSVGVIGARTPLGDVSNSGVVAAGVNVAVDVKRQKTS